MGGQVVHVTCPGLNVADSAVRRWIVKRGVGRFLRCVRNGLVDQVIVVAIFTMDHAGASLAFGNSALHLTSNGPFINTTRFSRQTSPIDRVVMASAATIHVHTVEARKIGADMAPFAVSEDELGAIHVVVGGIAMLMGANHWVTGLASYRGRGGVSAAASGNGIFDLLEAAAVTGLAVGTMGGVDFSKGVAWMGVAVDGTVRCHAQFVMAGIIIVSAYG